MVWATFDAHPVRPFLQSALLFLLVRPSLPCWKCQRRGLCLSFTRYIPLKYRYISPKICQEGNDTCQKSRLRNSLSRGGGPSTSSVFSKGTTIRCAALKIEVSFLRVLSRSTGSSGGHTTLRVIDTYSYGVPLCAQTHSEKSQGT